MLRMSEDSPRQATSAHDRSPVRQIRWSPWSHNNRALKPAFTTSVDETTVRFPVRDYGRTLVSFRKACEH